MNSDIGQSMGQGLSSIKDNGQVSVSNSSLASLGDFAISDIAVSFSLKAEKLASAVYLVSGLLSDNEPMKWNIRNLSTSILSDTTNVVSGTREISKGQACSLNELSVMIFRIVSMLRVSWMGGLISKMNYEILSGEYKKLNNILVKNFGDTEDKRNTITPSFFSSGHLSDIERKIASNEINKKFLGEDIVREEERYFTASVAVQESKNFIKDISYKGQLSDKSDFVLNKNYPISPIAVPTVSQKSNLAKEVISVSVSDINKKNRHDKMLRAMSPGISYSVSEIISIIGKDPNTSEKTIQRDLQQMVSLGRLKKTGERRWSRYALS
jgi:hypothetical protein